MLLSLMFFFFLKCVSFQKLKTLFGSCDVCLSAIWCVSLSPRIWIFVFCERGLTKCLVTLQLCASHGSGGLFGSVLCMLLTGRPLEAVSPLELRVTELRHHLMIEAAVADGAKNVWRQLGGRKVQDRRGLIEVCQRDRPGG